MEYSRALGRTGVRLLLVPAVFYLAIFTALTWPLMQGFTSLVYTDCGDGYQMVWNIWWVNEAVTVLHQNPWHTHYLHYPHGISLLGHTLHPFNGFLAVGLLKLMPLLPAFNTIVVFSFVMGGITAFWLAYHVTRGYWPAMVAGFIFTFSNYHFAHAQGHLQLVSLEWIPLFLLLWLSLLEKPTIAKAFGAATALLLVILCDYYYFFYCVLAGGIAVVWRAWGQWRPFLRKEYFVPLLVFAILAAATSGVLAAALGWLSSTDPLSGIHSPRKFPLDPFALLIPGGHWRFAGCTQLFWTYVPGGIHENSVHLGIAVTVMLIWAAIRRDRLQCHGGALWATLLVFFGVMALGPRLNSWGHEFSWPPMPYVLMEKTLPLFRVSGVPVRMVTMVILSAAIISAVTLQYLWAQPRRRAIAILLLCLLVVEYLPAELPAHRPTVPEYVRVLQRLPAEGGVYDTETSRPLALFYQTVHKKPIAFGYVSREPLSTRQKDADLRSLFDRKEYQRLADDYGFRYLVIPEDHSTNEPVRGAKTMYRNGILRVVRLP